MEKIENFLLVVDDEDSGVGNNAFARGSVVEFEDFFIQPIFFDAPTSPDLNGGELATLDEVIDGGDGNTEVIGGFFDGQKVKRIGCGAHFRSQA